VLTTTADGRMATVLLGEIKNNVSQNQNQIDLTPTGLLMEGGYTQNPIFSQMALINSRDAKATLQR
jgi:phage gp29-like protein